MPNSVATARKLFTEEEMKEPAIEIKPIEKEEVEAERGEVERVKKG